jgi:translocation and assembly module TamB
MTSTPKLSKPRRRWRGWLAVLSVLSIGVLGVALAALPWIVSLGPVQRQLTVQANRLMAPGSVRFDRLRVSWSRPTEIEGLVLRDAQGDDIVAGPKVQFGWNLWEILVTRPATGMLILDRADVSIERFADGRIDLLETLRPIISDRPKRTVLIRVVEGALRFRIEGLNEPIVADSANIELDLNAYPGPVAWRMKLARTIGRDQPGHVQVDGSMSRQKAENGLPVELALAIKGHKWPWAYARPGIDARGIFDGKIDARQAVGKWSLAGDVQLHDLVATGSALAGDTPRLESVVAVWKADKTDEGWLVERLDVTSPLGAIKASGSMPPVGGRGAHVEGNLDLAALARQIPSTLRLHEDIRVEQGSVQLQADVTGDAAAKGQTIHATARLAGLEAKRGGQTLAFHDPATLAATLQRRADALILEELEIETPFLTATGKGDLDRGITVSAAIDLGKATDRLREWVDFGPVRLAGQGKVDARYQRIATRFEANARAELRGLSASGLPAIESFHRDLLECSLDANGNAGASGLPSSLHELTLKGGGNPKTENVEFKALLDDASGVLSARLRARCQLAIGGKKQTADAGLDARWSKTEVMLDQLEVALTPAVGPGGQFLPGETKRWSGNGRYDIGKDELTIAADAAIPADKSQTTNLALWPTEVRGGGFKSRGAAWVEASLAGSLAGLGGAERSDKAPLDGRLKAILHAKQNPEGWDLGARGEVFDVSTSDDQGRRQVFADKVSASLRAGYSRKLDQVEMTELAVVSPWGRVEASGAATNLSGTPEFDLKGKLSPDWQVLTGLLARKVEPNASITGGPREWRLAGKIPSLDANEIVATLRGDLGVNLEQVDVFGMRLGRTALVVHARDGKFLIDPIDSTLNSGRLHLEPEVIEDKQGQTWVHLGPNSGLLDAVVNDEVSHRVLSFAAPVLDQATRVQGSVSLALNDAFIPIGPKMQEIQARVDGDVLFDNVEFMPGPLADQLIGVFRQERRPLLVLRDPISIRILGRKIYQEGLVIPLGNVAAIGLDGSIDFDQNLDLVARFAMVPPRRNIPVLSQILENTQLQVPITGTLKKPKLNGEAIKDRFKDMGTNLLETMMDVGASGLNRVFRGGRGAGGEGPARRDVFPPFARPDDDQAPPPPQPGLGQAPKRDDAVANSSGSSSDKARAPGAVADKPPGRPGQLTAEERQLQREARRERRLEKKAERRARRGLPPQ